MAEACSYKDSGLDVSEIDKWSERPHAPVPSAQRGPPLLSSHAGDHDDLIEACPNPAPAKPARKNINVIQCIGSSVSHGLESFFYNLGFGIASRPWTVILCCFLLSALCGLGMIQFEMKDSSAPIWIPAQSKVQANQEWAEKNFPLKTRYNILIVKANNILSAGAIREMYNIDRMVKSMVEYNNSISDVYNYNWSTICIPYGDACVSRSLLELWEFDQQKIGALLSTTQIVKYLASVTLSPVYNLPFIAEDWLGDLTYNVDGEIISAKVAKMVYAIQATSGDQMNTQIDAPDLLWETRFLELAQKLNDRKGNIITSVDVQAVRSFRDEYDKSFEADIGLIAAGIGIIVCYVAIIMGKFNEVEHKVYLTFVGVFGIGLAILVSYGLASALGQFYGPIHPILPFLLLGLGVDDMFVIIEAWNNLSAMEKQKPLPEKVALTMKHAGVSITVTSITDFVAFAIGASTALPALKSFCVYAALGILFLFIMQSTFFVAWLTIDQRRQDATRDACCIWIKYYNFVPNSCSQREFLPWILRRFIAPALTTLPIKVLVLSLVLCLLGLSGYGAYRLKTDSDMAWFLPTDSYLLRFLDTYESSFDEGIPADLYIGNVSYYNDTKGIQALVDELESSKYVKEGSVVNWQSSFIEWVKTREAKNVGYYGLELPWMKDDWPPTESYYFQLLNAYVGKFQPQYYSLLHWNDSDPYKPRRVEASKMSFSLKKLESTEEEIKCLIFMENLTEFHYGREAFVWTPQFRNVETNRVIGNELYTNLGLAFAAVFMVTLLLVANIWVCLLVCVSVVITLVNVCGMMHFWNLTIDTLTSILLILSMGLAIDYSAHIGHTFMTVAGSKNERAKITVATMGAAVINGGFSTFLAFILLATSNSYVFITFFKVFFLVVVFGLFNGLALLPVLLSWIGPAPYHTATYKVITSNMSITLKDLSNSKPVDLDRLLTGRKRTIPDTSNLEKVEQYIESLPDRTVLVSHSNENFQPNSLQSGDIAKQEQDLDEMLHNLEKESSGIDNTNGAGSRLLPQAKIHFDNHQHIIEDCEKYLERH
ncbi:patched domain-containing protein 3-like [Watersipora subatra]|uniref:patched domain-containing protein 3-like n=1 Tax=Watersipora subatra TaxID=2589382 RepID=UPI00355C3A01